MIDPEEGPAPDADETRAQESTGRTTETIGAFRLIQPLGEGGMGIVWLAEQTMPVRRTVALKIIKAGMDSSQVVARFEAERQALALMDHPAIARVFEAGATAQGRPYFVMEYVKGASIAEYCERHKLSIRDRIDIFLQVCDGVQHAHQKGVIHRDLKPSNVLVTVAGDRPVPKIIDFGVAKATTQPLTDRTLYTELGMFVGTPEYMSPEQAEMSGLDVDTRTDVYSLGAILYELLTGFMPFESRSLREKGVEDIRRTLREIDPPKPSTRVTAAAGTPASGPRTFMEPSKLASALKGDLDWITMKALDKDRTRRYGSASDLAADLRRHLENQPVLAGPPTTAYRVGKFVRRHRAGVAAAAALLVLVIGFGVTMAVQARRIVRERDRANQEQAAAKAVSDFLRFDVLAQATVRNQARPDVRPDPDIKVRTALDRAAARVDGKFGGQPLVEASIRETIGRTYGALGLYDAAQQQLQRSYEIGRRVSGDEGDEALRALDALAWLHAARGNFAEAVQGYAALLTVYTRRYGPRHPDVIRTLSHVAWNEYLKGDRARGEAALKEVLQLEREVVGATADLTQTSINNLATIYLERGAWKEAEPLLTEALAASRRTNGAEHPLTVATMDRLAQVFGQQGRYDEAEGIRREVLAINLRILGTDHQGTTIARNSLAQNLINQGDPARRVEAERLLDESLAVARRVNGEHHLSTNSIKVRLAEVYTESKRYVDAEALLREAIQGMRQLPQAQPRPTLNALDLLGEICLEQRKYVDAERVLREAVTGWAKVAPDDWRRFDSESLLGASLAGQRRFEEAERLLVDAYQGMEQRVASIPAYDRESLTAARRRLVDLYTAWRKPAQAADWQRRVAPDGAR